ncbi:MAG: DUF2232 domain-containing protein [Candidatus Binatia bacterium]
MDDLWMSHVERIKHSFLALVSSLCLFLAAVLVPIAGTLFLPLVPQPLLRLGVRWGKATVLGTILTVIPVLYGLGGRELVLGYLIVASMAVFLLFSLAPGRSLEKVVLAAATGFFALGCATLHALAGSLAQLQNVIRNTLGQNLQLALKVYDRAGVSPESTEYLREQWPQLVEFVLEIAPALAFTGCAVAVLLNLLLLVHRFPHARGSFLPAGDPKEWKSPEALVWGFIGAGFCALVLGNGWIKTLSLNFFLVSLVFYFFQGLAIIAYYFHHKNVPVFLRGLGYTLIFLEQVIMLIVVGLGLFDLWGDFRRLNKKDFHPTPAS